MVVILVSEQNVGLASVTFKMHIYTRKGDQGKTTLFGGTVVDKDDIRIEACGVVDELNSFLGLAAVSCINREVKNIILYLQNDLFTLQAEIAAQSAEISPQYTISQEHIIEMEQHINRIERQLPQQVKFILPGGNQGSATIHVARAIARRAERCIVSLTRQYNLDDLLQQYINRLSDLLHILSRLENKAQDERHPTYDIMKEKEEQQSLSL